MEKCMEPSAGFSVIWGLERSLEAESNRVTPSPNPAPGGDDEDAAAVGDAGGLDSFPEATGCVVVGWACAEEEDATVGEDGEERSGSLGISGDFF